MITCLQAGIRADFELEVMIFFPKWIWQRHGVELLKYWRQQWYTDWENVSRLCLVFLISERLLQSHWLSLGSLMDFCLSESRKLKLFLIMKNLLLHSSSLLWMAHSAANCFACLLKRRRDCSCSKSGPGPFQLQFVWTSDPFAAYINKAEGLTDKERPCRKLAAEHLLLCSVRKPPPSHLSPLDPPSEIVQCHCHRGHSPTSSAEPMPADGGNLCPHGKRGGCDWLTVSDTNKTHSHKLTIIFCFDSLAASLMQGNVLKENGYLVKCCHFLSKDWMEEYLALPLGCPQTSHLVSVRIIGLHIFFFPLTLGIHVWIWFIYLISV